MPSLTPNATEESRIRLELATELATGLPPELAPEAAVTGSVARGLADEGSDIELNLWAEEVPALDRAANALQAAGADDLTQEDPEPDGSIWFVLRFGAIWIEAGWQSIAATDELLGSIAAAKETDHGRLVVADVVANAVPLRTEGVLESWQRQLSDYPEALRVRLIEQAARTWSVPNYRQARRNVIRRGQRFALAQQLVWDVADVFRVLFATNRRWEPDWKWAARLASELPLTLPDLSRRVNAIFGAGDPGEAVALCERLVLDTLELVEPPPDVSRARARLEESLRRDAGI